MMKRIFLLPFILITIFSSSQEFKASVSVSASQLQGTDRRIFEELQKALYEFVNERAWTNYQYGVEEKIECTFMLTLSDRVSSNEYLGRLNVVYRRPVFQTSYETPMLNYVDKDVQFKYDMGEPLNYAENIFSSNLTSLFAYYIYIILGLDFDSYSLYGGTSYFQKAQSIVNGAQGTIEKGWKAFESQRNRYWLVENLLNSSYTSIRTFLYNYHRKGLDVMSTNLEMGRSTIAESLEDLRKANRNKPGLFLVQILLDTKRDELGNIFKEASPMDKTKALNILSEIDPSNVATYQRLFAVENK
jgi:hypothetical protein